MVNVVFGVGYIGSRLVQDLLYEGREVVGLDNLFSTDPRAIAAFRQSPDFRFVEGSILDPSAVEQALDLAGEVEAVYLLAAQASAAPDAAPPEYTETVNLQGPRVILDALARRKVGASVVYASSLWIYGRPLPPLVDESTPLGVFGDLAHLSKCYVEKLLEMYAVRDGVPARSVRLGLTYGVAPVLKTDPRFMTVPNRFCLAAARGEMLEIRTREALPLIGVGDAVLALRLAAGTPGQFRAFNAATEVATLSEIVEHLEEFIKRRGLGAALRVVDRGAEATVAPRPTIRSRLVEHGFAARRPLAEALGETFDHFWVRDQTGAGEHPRSAVSRFGAGPVVER